MKLAFFILFNSECISVKNPITTGIVWCQYLDLCSGANSFTHLHIFAGGHSSLLI